MLTNQLKVASQTALKSLSTSHRGIKILASTTVAQPQVVSMPLSEPTVDENLSSKLLMISPPPSPTAPSAVISSDNKLALPLPTKEKRCKGQVLISLLKVFMRELIFT